MCLTPRVLLHESPLDRLSEVLLEVFRENALRFAEFRRAEAEPRVLVLAHVSQFFGVQAHLLEKRRVVPVVRVRAALKVLKFLLVFLVELVSYVVRHRKRCSGAICVCVCFESLS